MATIKKSAAGLDRAEKREARHARRDIRKGITTPTTAKADPNPPESTKASPLMEGKKATLTTKTPELAKSTPRVAPKPVVKAKAKVDDGEGKRWAGAAARIKAKTAAISAGKSTPTTPAASKPTGDGKGPLMSKQNPPVSLTSTGGIPTRPPYKKPGVATKPAAKPIGEGKGSLKSKQNPPFAGVTSTGGIPSRPAYKSPGTPAKVTPKATPPQKLTDAEKAAIRKKVDQNTATEALKNPHSGIPKRPAYKKPGSKMKSGGCVNCNKKKK
jgi:hypothetical protein